MSDVRWIVRLRCTRPGSLTTKHDYVEEREVFARTDLDAVARAAEEAEGQVIGCESAKKKAGS